MDLRHRGEEADGSATWKMRRRAEDADEVVAPGRSPPARGGGESTVVISRGFSDGKEIRVGDCSDTMLENLKKKLTK